MTELVQHRAGGRLDRRTSREIALVRANTNVSLARVDAATEIQATRVHGAAFVAGQALHAVALVTELEQQLAQVTPEAAGRLAAIGNMATVGFGEIVADTVRELR